MINIYLLLLTDISVLHATADICIIIVLQTSVKNDRYEVTANLD